MRASQLLTHVVVSTVVAAGVLFTYHQLTDAESSNTVVVSNTASDNSTNWLTNLPADYQPAAGAVDFTYAAARSTPAVVHVRKFYTGGGSYTDPWSDFFGNDFYRLFGTPRQENPSRQEVASGSGVIISQDGFIVTNNHVIDEADEIEVTLFDNRTLKATLIGTDPSTDLALLKVDTDQELASINLGNSDSAMVGEWVLAVGNPFDLTSTVTAGIISAKGRNINILSRQSRMPIESFIQTDAAVNPGNSGGALVNTRGELIGINTAIATPTGTFAGYSFAVPVNIVKKVITDLREFGIVQRAFLGVQIRDVDEQLAEEKDLDRRQGVYILNVNDNSGALDAGLQEGDVIIAINGTSVATVAELQEQISRYRPGDKVDVDFVRGGETLRKVVTLKNQLNGTEVVEKKTTEVLVDLGASFEDLTASEKRQYEIDGGVRIADLRTGKLTRNTNIREGFIITRIDRKSVSSASDLIETLESKGEGDGVMLEGFYPQNPAKTYYYAFGM